MTTKISCFTGLIFTIACFSIYACRPSQNAPFNPPQVLNDGWHVSTAEEEGFLQNRFEEIISNIPENNSQLDGIVVARHGKLIADQYYNGYSADKLHKIWSITKPISGTALGIAVDKGLLSITDSIGDYLDNYIADSSSITRSITIEHLITMTSGIKWIELGGPSSSGFQLAYAEDWIDFVLSQPQVKSPGLEYNYSTGNTVLLAPIMKLATGSQTKEFTNQHLFTPMEITNYEWDTQSEFWTKTQSGELPGTKQPSRIEYKKPFADYTNTGSGLRMRTRDICKLGQLYLNNGKWDNQQIVSEAWVKSSIQAHYGNDGYGYHWKLMTFQEEPCYYATGFGLQRVFVFPNLDLVIALTQHHYETMPRGEDLTNFLLKDILQTIRE